MSSDTPFNKVNAKLKLHHGIEFSQSAIQKITLYHAGRIKEQQLSRLGTVTNNAKKIVISQTDGCMVGIIKIDPEATDKRKNKKANWQELKLSMAFEPGSLTPYFSGTMGKAQEAGKHIHHCVKRVGLDKNTHIHAVGDGAVWIRDQVDEHFGSNASYLVDFYHVSEYLAKAAETQTECSTKQWLSQQQMLLKDGLVNQVLSNLQPYRQIKRDNKYPADVCYSYIYNRRDQLDYKTAISANLPIGSGQIESAHRYVVQDRLKRPGAWWLEENADSMLNLRICRENNEWDAYWDDFRKIAA